MMRMMVTTTRTLNTVRERERLPSSFNPYLTQPLSLPIINFTYCYLSPPLSPTYCLPSSFHSFLTRSLSSPIIIYLLLFIGCHPPIITELSLSTLHLHPCIFTRLHHLLSSAIHPSIVYPSAYCYLSALTHERIPTYPH